MNTAETQRLARLYERKLAALDERKLAALEALKKSLLNQASMFFGDLKNLPAGSWPGRGGGRGTELTPCGEASA